MSSTLERNVSAFLEDVAAKTPAPGGGAVAATSGALAAAIAEMVVAYSVGKKSLAEHEDELRSALERLRRARAMLLELADEDAEAYAQVSALMKLPEGDPERIERWAGAVETAVRVPQSVIATAAELARLFETLCDHSNTRLASDLAVAAVLAEAAARAAHWNVRANLSLVDDDLERSRLMQASSRMVIETRARAANVERVCASTVLGDES